MPNDVGLHGGASVLQVVDLLLDALPNEPRRRFHATLVVIGLGSKTVALDLGWKPGGNGDRLRHCRTPTSTVMPPAPTRAAPTIRHVTASPNPRSMATQ